jgi:hypothetical protein
VPSWIGYAAALAPGGLSLVLAVACNVPEGVRAWATRKGAWAARKPYFWASLALICGTVAWVAVWPAPTVQSVPSDARIRAWALLLQLVGAWTVWRDLMAGHKRYGSGGIVESYWQWWREGLGRGRAVALSASVAMFGHTSMSARLRVGTAHDGTIEGRLAALEADQKRVRDEIDALDGRVAQAGAVAAAALEEESKARKAADDDLDTRLRDVVIGNFGPLLFGASWVAVGTVLSALAPDIAKAVAGQWEAVRQAFW